MKKNATRNALFMSVLSLLLCVSMLVGTTFAWFTDEVESGLNTIAAGNLDIEMYHTNAKVEDEKVQGATELFLDVNGDKILWEPGVVSYENIKIANVGSLALQYRLRLNIANENYLNGHGLSEVLKVVLLDTPIAAGATRADVMALATAALEDPNYTLDGKLNHLVEQGKLYPEGSTEGDSSITGALVIFWAPNANEIDNLYNVNNGQVTSDEKPLHIDFGVKLEATQLMYEEDSFGNNYDQFTGFQPLPAVDGHGPEINYTEGIGGAAGATTLDVAYQFRPTESDEEGQLSQYYNYFVDFEVYADKYVPVDSIMLAGYYQAWCGPLDGTTSPDSWNINGGNWVGLVGGDVDANTRIRLVEGMGGGAMNIQYKHLLQYGNDGIGFLCGAKDLTGENAGTTITVELNLYEAENVNGSFEETGKVITVGEFKYTFPAVEVASMNDLKAAIEAGIPLVDAKGANLGDFDYDVSFPDGMTLQNAEFSYFYGGKAEGTVTFENCKFVSDHSYSCHFDAGGGKLVFNNCEFDGWNSFGSAIANVEMNDCTFRKEAGPYGVLRFYQNAQLNNCTVEDTFVRIDTNVSGTVVEFTGCTGIDGKIANNGSNVGVWIVDGVDISDTIE